MAREAQLEDTPAGIAPANEGWFVLNVRDAAWFTHDAFGAGCRFEGRGAPFAELGINVRVLEPGQPNALYHRECGQEDFLVLAGECLLLVEGEERRLRAWDFVHCPAGTAHVFVGAGEAPCILLMAGVRGGEISYVYPSSDVARRHGAGAESETSSPAEAYSSHAPPEPGRPEGWNALPWA